jgi:putative ABC transport system permease protein
VILDLLREARDGILAHRARSLLSTLGILFGVGAVIGILSIGEGARREQEALISQLGILNVQIQSVELPEDEEEATELRRKSSGLAMRDLAALERILPEAVHVGGMVIVEEDRFVPLPDKEAELRVVGADPAWLASTPLVRVAGRPLSARDEDERATVCLLGVNARRSLFGSSPALGAKLKVGDLWLTVVGVVDVPGGASSTRIEGVEVDDRTNDIFLPLSTALSRLEREPDVAELSEIQIAVPRVEAVGGHVTLASRALQRLHREQADFTVVVPLTLLEQSQAQQRIFNLVMGLIAGISLLVGGIGIMNIMLASVLERTREIGVRLAIGATPRDIRDLFIAEASMISLVGGILGIAAGYGISVAVGQATGWATAVSVEAVLIATLVSMAEGVVFGWVPARRAARLPPATALRAM